MRLRAPLAALTCALVTLVGGPAAAPAAPTHPAGATTVTIDPHDTGKTFDGIGAISGGGGNSRLLTDYPPAQRDQILDYLFKPGYGAALQVLKLEIGGDANSTDGSEPSVEHAKGAVDCDAGYEFWLGEQAKARNPNIKLYGLAWAAPGWIGGGNFWSTDTVNYLMTWMGCAKSHGLAVDYLGGWNERGYDKGWYENLHSALQANGYGGTKVVGADSGWDVADAMVNDPTFAKSIDIVGAHYPCEGGDGGSANSCSTTGNAKATGKPLWASENGSQDQSSGTGALIRSITRGYVDAGMTAYLNWPLLAAIYQNLPYNTVGLATAAEPWSGAYSLGRSLWATAQVTQFSQPGWRFLDHGSGLLGGDRTNGSYVTLASPDGKNYSSVLETSTATAAQAVTVRLAGAAPTGTAHVWTTDLAPGGGTLVHTADVTPSNGGYTLTLKPNTITTVSTTTGQGHGTAASPARHALGLPYADNFDGTKAGGEARYLSDMQGSYQVEPCDGRSGNCLRQMAPTRPIEWQDDSDAFTMFGDTAWTNYTVSSDVRLAGAGTVELMGRLGSQSRPQSHQNGYEFRVSDTGAASIVRTNAFGGSSTVASGTGTALGTGTWHRLAVTFDGNTITGTVDGRTAVSGTDGSFGAGQAGLGVVGYRTDEFDNLTVTPGSGGGTGVAGTGPVTGLADKCMDVTGQSPIDGTAVELWDCNAGLNQQWSFNGDGTVRSLGKCLDLTHQGTDNGTAVEIWTCNGGANQQWQPGPNGTLRNPVSGRCLDVPKADATSGGKLELWDCNGGGNQRWALPT